MPNLGGWELVIVLVIILLLFGVGRIGQIGGELGRAIREFRRGLSGEEENKTESKTGSDEAAKKDTPKND